MLPLFLFSSKIELDRRSVTVRNSADYVTRCLEESFGKTGKALRAESSLRNRFA
jgi:hypothetical protein